MSVRAIEQHRPANGLLDRYWLPKVALVLISFASLVGVYLTMTVHGAPPAWALVRWIHLASLGALAGGTLWWAWFVKPPAEESEKAEIARFALAQQERFGIIGLVAWALVILTAPNLLWFQTWAGDPIARGLWVTNVAALSLAVALMGWLLLRPRTLEHAFDHDLARAAWFALVATIAATAVLDASLTFPNQALAWVLRPIHVLAFTLWIGGAIWNIFVEVPGAQATLAFSVVVAAAQQLERFRRTVRVFLPTLVITGLLQAYPYVGLNLGALGSTFFGQLILLKLGLVIGLVGIFITCPMWRACSPIKGMCDLEDLNKATSTKMTLPAPTQRLDNRGRACAGFVQIQKQLQVMEPHDTLELLSTDPISWWELPAWLQKHGHHLLDKSNSGHAWWKSYRFLVQKGAYDPTEETPTPAGSLILPMANEIKEA